MFIYALKTITTLALIIAATEIAKRSSIFGGLVASVPLISVGGSWTPIDLVSYFCISSSQELLSILVFE